MLVTETWVKRIRVNQGVGVKRKKNLGFSQFFLSLASKIIVVRNQAKQIFPLQKQTLHDREKLLNQNLPKN